MAYTKGIKHRRANKSALELDPPAFGEMVYAIDTGEWGTRLLDGSLKWKYIFDDDLVVGSGGSGGSGVQIERMTNPDENSTSDIIIPSDMTISNATILFIDGVLQTPDKYTIVNDGTNNKFVLDTPLSGGEDILIQNGTPVDNNPGDVTIDLSGGITLPTWKGRASGHFQPFLRLYNNFIIELDADIIIVNPFVTKIGHSGKLIFIGPIEGARITFDSSWMTPQENVLQIQPGELIVLDYIMYETQKIVVTRTLTWEDTRVPFTPTPNPDVIYSSSALFPASTNVLTGLDNTKYCEIRLSWNFVTTLIDSTKLNYTISKDIVLIPTEVSGEQIFGPLGSNAVTSDNYADKDLVLPNQTIKYIGNDRVTFSWGSSFLYQGGNIQSVDNVYFKATLLDVR